jgi:hypothetical protein
VKAKPTVIDRVLDQLQPLQAGVAFLANDDVVVH